jgi:hypothetical protein
MLILAQTQRPNVSDFAALNWALPHFRFTRWAWAARRIEQAIRSLGEDKFARIADRVHALEQERWDAELDRDASSGKLDFLIAEARDDRRRGRLKDWPTPE